MSDESPRLLDLARRISEGMPVDWREAERASGAEETDVVRSLREVAAVIDAHRSVHASGGVPAESARVHLPTLEPDAPVTPIGHWGPLQILAPLGAGARGEVFRALDNRLQREVALKLLRATATRGHGTAPPAGGAAGPVGGEQAIIAEGRLMARVRHANVAAVHGAEVHDGRVGLWMELVRGRTLTALLHEGGVMGAREAGLIGLDLCAALASVHHAGLVHRDVKTDNVMREEGGRIVLMDFSIGADRARASGQADHRISGTPLYMAPELLRGAPATAASDLYALGVLLFHLVSGGFPIAATGLDDLRAGHAAGARRALGELRPDLPAGFVRVVERALAADPGDRFPTAAAMEQALAAVIGVATAREAAGAPAAEPSAVAARAALATRAVPAHQPARRRWAWGAVAAGLAGAALLALFVAHQRPRPGPVERAAATPATAPVTAPVATPAGAGGGAGGGAGSYRVEAAFFRGTGVRERLAADDRVRIGDALSIDFQSSRDVYLYVINEDDQGEAVVMFPFGGEEARPLAAGRTHRIPGERDGTQRFWQVTSAGGREHFLVIASPERLTELEKSTLALGRPEANHPLQYTRLSDAGRVRLRGVAGLLARPAAPTSPRTPLFEAARRLPPGSDEADGAWMRRFDLENPAP